VAFLGLQRLKAIAVPGVPLPAEAVLQVPLCLGARGAAILMARLLAAFRRTLIFLLDAVIFLSTRLQGRCLILGFPKVHLLIPSFQSDRDSVEKYISEDELFKKSALVKVV
jgi:hypothetical protein